jgi:hypothetical protein
MVVLCLAIPLSFPECYQRLGAITNVSVASTPLPGTLDEMKLKDAF